MAFDFKHLISTVINHSIVTKAVAAGKAEAANVLVGSVKEAASGLAVSEFDKAVIVAKKLPIGKAAVEIVQTTKDSSLSNEEKMAKDIESFVPVLFDFVKNRGFAGETAQVEGFARQILESTLADVRETGASLVAQAILTKI